MEIPSLTDEQVLEKAIREWFPGYDHEDQDQMHRR